MAVRYLLKKSKYCAVTMIDPVKIGAHALACAARLPGSLAALCVAGMAPYDARGLDWMAGQGQDSECGSMMSICILEIGLN